MHACVCLRTQCFVKLLRPLEGAVKVYYAMSRPWKLSPTINTYGFSTSRCLHAPLQDQEVSAGAGVGAVIDREIQRIP